MAPLSSLRYPETDQQLETADGRGGTSTRRDYAGAFVFVNNAPGWVGTPHGRFVLDGTWKNEFHLRDHLGNTRVVLLEEEGDEYKTLQQNHYYPFGMLIPTLSTSNTLGALKDNRYLYNGKLQRSGNPDPSGEFNDDFDLDWYDYGARFYDAQIGRWHSVDPHSENYYSISTYAYAVNNPIVFIDPDGRDIWHINEKGEFEWISESDTHVAYVVDKDGNRTDKSLELNDRTIFDQLTESTNINRTKVSRANTDGAGADELYKTFLFLADNIDVEWRLDRFNQSGTEGFTLGTIHESSMAPTAEQLGHSISDVISMLHSHPEVGPNMRDELRSMGSRNGVMITRSDWENVAYYHTTNGKQDFYYYTYFPISGRLYHVNSFQPPSYMRNINQNHKRFFFGTMK